MNSQPLFLYIPIMRLILMSVVSFSAYEFYWIYRNWRYLKERERLDIQPFWRGWFGILYCYSLLRHIHEDKEAREVKVPTFSPGGLTTGWIILIILANAIIIQPGIAAGIIAAVIPSCLCLVPVQIYVNAVTRQKQADQRYYPWSIGHFVCLFFGLIVWYVILTGN